MNEVLRWINQQDPRYIWLPAFAVGFHLRDKIPRRLQRIFTILTLLSLIPVGVAVRHGVLGSAPSPPMVRPIVPKSRVLAERLEPDPGTMRQLRDITTAIKAEEAARQRELLKRLRMEESARRFVERAEARAAARQKVEDLAELTVGNVQPAGGRKGPFCRITCSFHHGHVQDVETMPEFCKANWIPPEAIEVPGWISLGDGRYEALNPWPGPANPRRGLNHYKLYWK